MPVKEESPKCLLKSKTRFHVCQWNVLFN